MSYGDICSHGRPNHQDLILELREAVGLFAGAMGITPKEAWEEAIAEVDDLRTRLAAAEAFRDRIVAIASNERADHHSIGWAIVSLIDRERETADTPKETE